MVHVRVTRIRTRALAALTVLTVTWASFACSSSSEVTPGPPDAAVDAAPDAADAAVCQIPDNYGSPDCEDCMRASCCDVITACLADADCAALQTCALACQDGPDPQTNGQCKTACEQMHPAGNAKWQQVYTCWFTTRHDANHPGCDEPCTEP